MRVPHPLRYRPRLSASFICTCSLRTISSAGSAAFSKKYQRHSFGCCTRDYVEQQESSSSSPAIFSATSLHQAITRALNAIKPPTQTLDFCHFVEVRSVPRPLASQLSTACHAEDSRKGGSTINCLLASHWSLVTLPPFSVSIHPRLKNP